MFNYSITTNEDKTITKQSWESHGYTLAIIALESGRTRIMVENPIDGPSIYVNDFSTEKAAVVNWSALGSKSPAEAREYAEQIIAATEVAEGFQQIIDAM